MPAPSHLIVVGASAGGMLALEQLVARLPADLPAALLVVQHFAPASNGQHLATRLARLTELRCYLATDGQPLEAGALYLAPPDRHLLAKNDPAAPQVRITVGPRENGFRPAADALFRSAAVAYGPRTVGVVLTGLCYDGAAGLEFIKRCGGSTVVQDPEDAEYPAMPEMALRSVDVDYVVPLHLLPPLLEDLARGMLPERKASVPEDLKLEAAIAEKGVGTTEQVAQLGRPAALTCPDCGGSLWQMKEGQLLRFRCHTGHAFTGEALLESTRQSLEETLWAAIRMMEERKTLLSNLAARREGPQLAQQAERVEEIKRHINRLREFLLRDNVSGTPKA